MYKISELVDNLQKKGNSKCYLPCENNTNWVIEFKINKKGELNILGSLETYDRPYWDGRVLDEDAVLLDKVHAVDYFDEDIRIPLSLVIYGTFYVTNLHICCEEEFPKYDTSLITQSLCKQINSMLTLSYKELTEWILSDENGIRNLLLNNTTLIEEIENFNPNLAGEYIDMLIKRVGYHLEVVRYVWHNLKVTDGNERIEAQERWTELRKDTALLK